MKRVTGLCGIWVLEEMRDDAWELGLQLYKTRGIKQVYTIVKIKEFYK